MKPFLAHPASSIKEEVSLPGDKSIAHRAIILSAIACGKTVIENFPANQDCLYTIEAIRRLGIRITCTKKGLVTVFGKGLYGFKKPKSPIFVGDSGTTLRLMLGVLAGQGFKVTLRAGKSLSKRPMLRVTAPLRLMGAKITTHYTLYAKRYEEYPPLTMQGGLLRSISYRMPVASAQVKSAILLAGLFAKGRTQVIEPIATRDHTERILRFFKAKIKLKKNKIVIEGDRELASPGRIYLPGDISSASFFMGLAAILPDSYIRIRNVSLNPTRSGIIRTLKRMGADIRLAVSGYRLAAYEPMADILVRSSKLRGMVVKKEDIPSLIDELPVLMVVASLATGKTIFEGVGELRVKETDRIDSMSRNLRKMGADIDVVKAGNSENIIIRGAKQLTGAQVRSFGDHRTAMSMVVAGLSAKGSTHIDDISCIDKSFPEFLGTLESLLK